MSWRAKAKQLYLESGMKVGDIAVYLEISRQSVSAYLKTLSEYDEERQRRKNAGTSRRKEYKRKKNQEYRMQNAVTGESLRREHDVAALILSREKYY